MQELITLAAELSLEVRIRKSRDYFGSDLDSLEGIVKSDYL